MAELPPQRLLPPLIRAVAAAAGETAALALVQAHGGTVIFVPRGDVGADHPLAELVGLDGLRVLREYSDRGYVRIPQCTGAWRALRNAQMVDDRYRSGLTNRELVGKYRLSDRRVRTIVNGTALPRNHDLFDDPQETP